MQLASSEPSLTSGKVLKGARAQPAYSFDPPVRPCNRLGLSKRRLGPLVVAGDT
jgi:hypothetical protein